MDKLSFAIIGPPTRNTADLCGAVSLLGHGFQAFRLSEVRFEMENGSICAMHGDESMLDFDIIIFRGYNIYMAEAQMVAEILARGNKTIIEENLGNGLYVHGKMQQAVKFLENSIRHPRTFQANSIEGWESLFPKLSFPVIAKPMLGGKGKDVVKLDTADAAREFLAGKSGFLVQQYFPIKTDYRVFIVGGKVIGGIKRFIFDGEYKSNVFGTRAEKVEVSGEMADLALAAVKAVSYEIAGVDLFEYEKKFYVLEVNAAPQWEKFKKATNINPAREIISYAIAKHQMMLAGKSSLDK